LYQNVINKQHFPKNQSLAAYIQSLKVGDVLHVVFERFGEKKETRIVLAQMLPTVLV